MESIQYSPKQAKKINKSTYRIIKSYNKKLMKLIKINKATAQQYEDVMCKQKYPYINQLGTRQELTMNEIISEGLKNNISSSTSLKILSQRENIEALFVRN